jgi:hypothetical protein
VRPIGAAAASIGLFGATLAAFVLAPSSTTIWLGLVIPAALVVVAIVRIDWTPWIVVPVLAGETLWAFSAPGIYFLLAFSALVSWLLLGIVLAVRFVGLGSRRPPTRETRWSWGAAAVTALVVVPVSLATMPLEVRFMLSEDAMNEVGRAVASGARDPATIDRIGTWDVHRVWRVPGGMRFTVDGTGFLSTTGFAYQPDGLRQDMDTSFRHYRGVWYLWNGGSS